MPIKVVVVFVGTKRNKVTNPFFYRKPHKMPYRTMVVQLTVNEEVAGSNPAMAVI